MPIGLALAPPLYMTLQRVIGAAGIAVGIVISGDCRVVAEPIDSTSARVPAGHSPHEIALDASASHSLLQNALGVRSQPNAQRVQIDLHPLLDNITGFLKAHGLPLHQNPGLSGNGGIAFSASMQVNENLPAVDFTIGDRGPFDAFYANDGGFRFSLKWPLPPAPQFSLHLGGGEDSEFGNWAIVGLQWLHPRRLLAVGLGMPIALQNAEGEIGVVCQFRMMLE